MQLSAHLCCSFTWEFMLLGVILLRNSMYSSEWNCVISRFVAGLARYIEISMMKMRDGFLSYKDFHFLIETIIHDEGMAHPDSRGLHSVDRHFSTWYDRDWKYPRMPWTIMKPTNIWVEEIALKLASTQCRSMRVENNVRHALTAILLRAESFLVVLENPTFVHQTNLWRTEVCNGQLLMEWKYGYNFHLWSYFARADNLKWCH